MEMETTQNASLLERDYTLIIDRSGSMGDPVGRGNNQSRWNYMAEETQTIAREISALDSDGITLYTFSNGHKRHDNVGPDAVKRVFTAESPGGSTNLAGVLQDAFDHYLSNRKRGKAKRNGEFVVVVTDGEPTDKPSVAKVITAFTKHLNSPKEFSMLFVQIGTDSVASEYLRSLDDDLEKNGAKYDIVSVITHDELGTRQISNVISQAIAEAKV